MSHDTIELPWATIDLERGQVRSLQGKPVQLSELEVGLLRLLYARVGTPVSTKELLREVWGAHPRTHNRPVVNLVSRLRKTVERPDSEPTFILTVRGGYVMELPEIRNSLDAIRLLPAHLDGPHPGKLVQQVLACRDAILDVVRKGLATGDLSEARPLALRLAVAVQRAHDTVDVPLLLDVAARCEGQERLELEVVLAAFMGQRDGPAAALEDLDALLPNDLPVRQQRAAHAQAGIIRARLLGRLGRYREAYEAASTALLVSRRLGLEYERIAALDRLGGIGKRLGRMEEAVEHLREGLWRAETREFRWLHAVLLHNDGILHALRGDVERWQQRLVEAAEAFSGIATDTSQLRVSLNLGNAQLCNGAYAEVLAATHGQLAHAEALGSSREIGHALSNRYSALLMLDRWEEAAPLLARAIYVGRQAGLVALHAHAVACKGWLALMRGQRADARRILRRAWRLLPDDPHDRMRVPVLTWLAATRPDGHAAARRLREFARRHRGQGQPTVEGYLGQARAPAGPWSFMVTMTRRLDDKKRGLTPPCVTNAPQPHND